VTKLEQDVKHWQAKQWDSKQELIKYKATVDSWDANLPNALQKIDTLTKQLLI